MKYFLTILLAIFSINAFALDECFTGSWYDKNRSGEGINIEVNKGGALTVAYFYTFDEDRRQTWFTFVGEKTLTMYQTVLLDYDDFITDEESIGVGVVEPVTNDVLIFAYDRLIKWLPLEEKFVLCNGKFETCSATYIYRRLTQPVACAAPK